jgi:ketosteroid isomerase-like protein
MSMTHLERLLSIDLAFRISERCLLAALCCMFCHCARQYDQKEAERYIVESERQWAESVASGDTTVIERILADDFIGVDPKGGRYDKSKMISDTRNAPEHFLSNQVNDVKVRFYGDTAIAQGDGILATAQR